MDGRSRRETRRDVTRCHFEMPSSEHFRASAPCQDSPIPRLWKHANIRKHPFGAKILRRLWNCHRRLTTSLFGKLVLSPRPER
jgi:hypothetical protein